MTTDFRAMCAELYVWLCAFALRAPLDIGSKDEDEHDLACSLNQLLVRARAALAAPEQGPTDEELYDCWMNVAEQARLLEHTLDQPAVTFARAVLTRWGRPAVEPVPDSERPWERDGWCDKEGMCWMGDGGGCGFVPSWRLCKPSDSCLAWSLPHWAIPVPQEGADG